VRLLHVIRGARQLRQRLDAARAGSRMFRPRRGQAWWRATAAAEKFPVSVPWACRFSTGHEHRGALSLARLSPRRQWRVVMTKIKHILVPTDFSAHADAAFRYAVSLAEQVGATVGLLHVIEEPTLAGLAVTEFYAAEATGAPGGLSKEAEALLRESAASAASDVLIVCEVRKGRPAATIVEAAREMPFDLIVMGTAGRSGVARAFMGSVAERVARTARCPVLTVRAESVQPAAIEVAAMSA
jgi:nucleotide-binding universal stress UspA family protein